MSSIEMRKQIISAYSGSYKNTPWEQKVNRMSNNQVMSIFLRLKGQGKL